MKNITLPFFDLTLNLTASSRTFAELGQAEETEISIDFTIDPGQPEIIRADPNDCEPGYSAKLDISAIKTVSPVVLTDGQDNGLSLTLPANTDITDLLRTRFIELENAVWDELVTRSEA
jgi:hypothetical protein